MKLFLLWILPVTLGDTHITCVYSKECILPCTSKNVGIIHWYKDKTPVHSFYHNEDQLAFQSKEYKGRTSLFPKSEIQKGNVSLLLKNIQVQDEGTYKCYAANDRLSDEKLMTMSVEAPVKAVDITLKDNKVICNTSGVYPEPDVSWFSNPLAKEPENNIIQTEENLFTVTSALVVGEINKSYTYKCSILSKNKTLYTAELEQQELQENNEFFVKCPVTKGLNYTLTLSFSTPILRYDSKTSKTEISKQWMDKVTFHPENGTVKLSDPNREHSGTYTCESTTAQHRYITKTVVPSKQMSATVKFAIIISVLAAIVAIALFVKYRKKLQKIFSKKPPKTPEQENLNENPANGETSPNSAVKFTEVSCIENN